MAPPIGKAMVTCWTVPLAAEMKAETVDWVPWLSMRPQCARVTTPPLASGAESRSGLMAASPAKGKSSPLKPVEVEIGALAKKPLATQASVVPGNPTTSRAPRKV